MWLTRVPVFILLLSSHAYAETVDYRNIKTPAGDKLPDFSFAGYHQSEAALPALDRPATKTLSPGSGDQSPAIQSALDSLQQSGGVLELEAGTYALSSGLLIHNHTTLRGAGIGKTILTVKDLKEDVITFGNLTGEVKKGESVKITDEYVPAGTAEVNVEDVGTFAVGQSVLVERGVTQQWIDAMGMTIYPKWLAVSCFFRQLFQGASPSFQHAHKRKAMSSSRS